MTESTTRPYRQGLEISARGSLNLPDHGFRKDYLPETP